MDNQEKHGLLSLTQRGLNFDEEDVPDMFSKIVLDRTQKFRTWQNRTFPNLVLVLSLKPPKKAWTLNIVWPKMGRKPKPKSGKLNFKTFRTLDLLLPNPNFEPIRISQKAEFFKLGSTQHYSQMYMRVGG